MHCIRLVDDPGGSDTLILAVPAGATPEEVGLVPTGRPGVPDEVRAEAAELVRTAGAADRPGVILDLPRPLRRPSRVLLVTVGPLKPSVGTPTGPMASEPVRHDAGWRAAGAAVATAVDGPGPAAFALPDGIGPEAVRNLAEGFWLASYQVRPAETLADADADADGSAGPGLLLVVDDPDRYAGALTAARVTARSTRLARDLTNAPSSTKSPAWLADRFAAATAPSGATVTVRGAERLAAEGFGGLLAVGGGSARPPCLVQVDWAPAGAGRHVVLVGKGITFDTGGISIKPRDGMKLMRKDMAGAAAVVAATVGAATLGLPVRITALAALAENMVSGSAFRPGDVIRHHDGSTSESTNSDAEGRLVLADALAYGAGLRPDVLVDLATLTGANAVALGRRTAALYTDSDELAGQLTAAAERAGEQMWRMPLPADYLEYLASDIADRHSSPDRGAGSVVAALYLREFTGELRDRWAHLDMSAPSWADAADGELTGGATGWGVRTLLRWLTALAD